ncbi:MAG: CHRD domain-containing protein [Candidatus Wildermuthbacteria bacterium]|nr:CHRD domain-containing protein [Candidatus Wildermuthbacteria bacterium]
MNKLLLILGIVVVAGIGWYLWSTGALTPSPAETPGNTDQEETVKIMVALGAQNNSGMSGTATLTEENGKTKVTLSLSGAPQGVAQPAHIHMNSCANIGAVKYPLTPLVNGNSETLADVSLAELKAGLPLSINAHKSAEEVSVYVACGDILIP